MVGKNRPRSWKGALVFSGVVLLASFAVMMFMPNERLALEVGALLAGLAVGGLFMRFGLPRPWMGYVVLVLFVVVWFALGTAGYAWFGGFLAGTFAGVAWGRAVKNRAVMPAAPWTVNEQGFANVAETRRAAAEALHAMDGVQRGRLSVQREDARFEAAGSMNAGFVCHRTPNTVDEGSWAVLVRDGASGGSVEVPMGGRQGLMPLRLVHDAGSVEAALADFFSIPGLSALGPEWETGKEAEATRLTTQ